MSYTVRRHSKHNVTSKKRKSLVVDDEPPIQELPVLRRKRTLVLNRLRKTLEVAQKAKEDASQIHSFLAHYSVVSKLCDTFEQVHSDILCLVDGESEDKEDIIRAEFDEIYFTVATIHRQLIPCNADSSVPSPTVPDRSCISNVKLPKIKIPTFSGLIKSWPEFYDIFNSLVHNNESLSDTERMHYLVSCLEGEALGLIRTYPVQGTFYREAYDTLVARYRDKRELAFTCWKEILNINFKSNSPYEFRSVLDLMRENLNILRGLGLPTDSWDFVLCYLILSKLDSKTRCAYEQSHTNTELPQFDELLSFLYTKCEALVRDTHFSAQERPKGSTPIRVQDKSQAVAKLNNKPFKSKTSVFFSNTNQSNRSSDNSNNSHSCSAPKTPNYSNVKCAFCSDIHSVNLCKRFAQTPVTERIAFAKLHRWCFNCLRPSHTVKDCKSIFRCQKCRHRHHTLLHCDNTENTTTPSIQPTLSSNSNDQVQVLTSLGNNSVVLLSTANVQIRDSSGNFQTVRALIDCGSQAHFITERAARSLGFEFTPTSRQVSGLGNSSSVVSGTIKIEIGARGKSLFTVDALTLPSICGKMPSSRLDNSTWHHLQHLTLADPDCHKPGPVDLLLGAEVFASLLLPGSVAGGPRQPSALNSVFGWLLLGTASGKEDLQSFFIKVDDLLNKEDKRLWELDSITTSSSDLLPPDEERCEAIYATQLSRDLEGRYVVTLPFKDDDRARSFPVSRDIALRCYSLERKFNNNSQLYKLFKYFVKDIYFPILPCTGLFAWSDSTVVLAWIRSHPSRWKAFVANRVSHIHDVIPGARWGHVSSEDNPADIVSRGQIPSALASNRLWWAGPSWLLQPYSLWPRSDGSPDVHVVGSEERNPHSLLTQSEASVSFIDSLLDRYSSIRKIQRVICVWIKFIDFIRNKRTRCSDLVSNRAELHNALMIVVKHVQSNHFALEIRQLQDGKVLTKQMRKLNPFLDPRGILRVGGRLARSGLEFEHKHPALLPRESRLTYLLIQAFHRENCHAGVNTMQYLLTQQFWILSPKRAIRHCLSKCLQCYKTKPIPLEPFMSDLPATRVNQVKPFSIVGTDYGGPFRIKLGKHRGAKIGKAYLCLFVCMSTKAVHLETVSDLSSDAFLAALRRFVGRRGRVSIIQSDCGTNYVGASNQLHSLMKSAAHTENIEFRFNPPSSPHFGGMWEIQIKAVKSHLYRIVGDQALTFEELSTLFVQIESMLNSRPLCPLSSDPNDLNVLTPGHFLTLEPLTSVPDEDLTSQNINRLGRWQLIQRFQQNFWNRWRHEYLQTLTQRAKWTTHSKPLAVGSIVILKTESSVPLHWPLARVEELHTSPDGIVRIATVRTSNGSRLTRPLVKLCPLPCSID